MRVLLVYTNQCREVVPAPPIGLSYVASATREAGHAVELLDLAFAIDIETALSDAIARVRPQIVGLSIRNIDNVVLQRSESARDELRAQIRLIRAQALDSNGQPVPLVLGGPAVSILGERALDFFGVDFAIVGEGEESFPDLLRALEDGATLEHVGGLCWRKAGETARCNPMRLLRGFGGSGMENWVDWRPYQAGGGTFSLQTKRGCPLRCSYCSYPQIEGRKIRPRPPSEVVDEIERVIAEARHWGLPRPPTFEFVDSTFNVPASHAMAVCEEIIRRGVKASFTTMGLNPRDVPPELLPLMKRAGFNSVMVTPEAACQTMLDNYAKGFTMAEVENTLAQVKASGLSSMWFFMLGAPGETMATCAETIAFARDRLVGRRFLSVIFLGIRVHPDTTLARQAVASGYLPPDVDLADTVYYLSPQIDEAAVVESINAAIVRNPCIVHAAEGGDSPDQQAIHRTLAQLDVAPPYWRFMPVFLRQPQTHFMRSRNPVLGGRDDGPAVLRL